LLGYAKDGSKLSLKLCMKYASLPQKIQPAENLRYAFVHFVIVADSPHKLLQNYYKTTSEQPPYLCQGMGLRTSLEFTSDLA
jgi:hypothetical protein